MHCSDFRNGTWGQFTTYRTRGHSGTRPRSQDTRLLWFPLAQHEALQNGFSACSRFSSQKRCHDVWLWFGLCARWMLLNKQAHCGDWGVGVGSVMLGSQSVASCYTCLCKPHPGLCSITLDRFSADLDMSVKGRLKADSSSLCRQQNETALWNENLSECKKWVTAAYGRFAVI